MSKKENSEKYNRIIVNLKNDLKIISDDITALESKEKQAEKDGGLPKIYLQLVHETLNAASYHLIMNDLSVALLGFKNQDQLTAARKIILRAIIYCERIVSNSAGGPFSDYKEMLDKIVDYPISERIKLVRKMGFTIDSLIEAYGENSYVTTFLYELDGRFNIIVKNFIDFRTAPLFDPTQGDYEPIQEMIKRADKGLLEAAERYRLLYEKSRAKEDATKAMNYLKALYMLYTYSEQPREKLEALKRKIQIWKKYFEDNERGREKSKGSGKK
jgi:hypothetical protein